MRIVYLTRKSSNKALILTLLATYGLLMFVIYQLGIAIYDLKNINYAVYQPILLEEQIIESKPQEIKVLEKSSEEIWIEKLAEHYNKNLFDVKYINSRAKYYSNKHKVDSYEVISMIGAESEFNKKAISYLGQEYGNGLLQVSNLVLIEYNRVHNTTYCIKDLYNIEINLEIGCWYYARLRDHYNIKDETIYMVSAYNAGPYAKELNDNHVNKVLANLSML